MSITYKIFKHTSPIGIENHVVADNVTLPYSHMTEDFGEFYYAIQAKNENGYSELSDVKKVVTINKPNNIVFTNDVGVVTATVSKSAKASKVHVMRSKTESGYAKLTSSDEQTYTFTIAQNDIENGYVNYKAYCTYEENGIILSTSEHTANFKYEVPDLSDLVLYAADNGNKIRFTYTGAEQANQVYLYNSNSSSSVAFANRTAEILKPTKTTTYYAKAFAGYSEYTSNTKTHAVVPVITVSRIVLQEAANKAIVHFTQPEVGAGYRTTLFTFVYPSGKSVSSNSAYSNAGAVAHEIDVAINEIGTYSVIIQNEYLLDGQTQFSDSATVSTLIESLANVSINDYSGGREVATISWNNPINNNFTSVKVELIDSSSNSVVKTSLITNKLTISKTFTNVPVGFYRFRLTCAYGATEMASVYSEAFSVLAITRTSFRGLNNSKIGLGTRIIECDFVGYDNIQEALYGELKFTLSDGTVFKRYSTDVSVVGNIATISYSDLELVSEGSKFYAGTETETLTATASVNGISINSNQLLSYTLMPQDSSNEFAGETVDYDVIADKTLAIHAVQLCKGAETGQLDIIWELAVNELTNVNSISDTEAFFVDSHYYLGNDADVGNPNELLCVLGKFQRKEGEFAQYKARLQTSLNDPSYNMDSFSVSNLLVGIDNF